MKGKNSCLSQMRPPARSLESCLKAGYFNTQFFVLGQSNSD